MLKFKMDNHVIKMTETILPPDLPDQISATYKAKGLFCTEEYIR